MDILKTLNHVNYYYITDEGSKIPLTEQAKVAVDNGVRMVQYRRKSGTDRMKYEEAKKIRDICKNQAIFVVDDRLDIALAAEADGVHLGQDDLSPCRVRRIAEDMLIGVSTHNLKEAKQAEGSADYIGIGPVRKTTTKEDIGDTLGISLAKKIASSVEVPTVAIGGIAETDLPSLAEKFDMICAISSVTRGGNFSEKVSRFEKKIRELKKESRRKV